MQPHAVEATTLYDRERNPTSMFMFTPMYTSTSTSTSYVWSLPPHVHVPCVPSPPPCVCQESSDKEVAAKQKAHKKWRKKLNWTPQRALEREGSSQDGLSSFACTDAVWLFPVLVVWLVMLAAVIYAARWGQPSRLLYGVDYELNVCGVDNGAAANVHTLRFSSQRAGTFPYEALPATASVAGSVDAATAAALKARTLHTGGRDLGPTDDRWWTAGRGSRTYLFYANPATRLPVCVERCPAVAAP